MKKNPFLLLWVGINIAGWATWIVFATNFTIFQSSNVLSILGFFIIGGILGILQWLLLRRYFSIAWYEWLIATTIGYGLGLYAFIWAALRDYYIVFNPPGTPVLEWDPLLGGALLGLALGCCQAIVWRPKLTHIFVWVVVNVLGWSLGTFLPQLAAFLLQDVIAIDSTSLLSTLFPLAFAAVVTGLTLVWFSGGQNELDTRS
ncbi:MAG: hypothetical protein DHS20C20_17670 [Ardenticatenaceae bacterium]|nr:MAG: hypothetical protein DHS20C20_17670 [Ardenticatenaceae bacterium]